MADLYGNNDIDDLMKKYDAIEKAVLKANDEMINEDSNDSKEEYNSEDYYQNADSNESEDSRETTDTDATEDFRETTDTDATEDFQETDESEDTEDFREAADTEDTDDFREITDNDDIDDFREVTDTPVMLDPSVPAVHMPDINLNGTGLVLAGGGGKGIYQVGMLKVLSEAGVLDDVVAISGVSIGAVNTVLYAMGVDRMEKVWEEIDMGTLFDFDEKQIAAGNTHFSRSEMNSLIEKYMDFDDIRYEKRVLYAGTSKCAANFSELDPTYGCTARYFMLNGATDEDINNYLLASTALPYIYSPVKIGSDRYIDGGINDNIPIRPLYDLGLRKFVVIELTSESKFKPYEFPGAEFISIVPSHDLGDLFTGTLNFDGKDKHFKKELGERDGKIYLKTKFEKDETYIAIERTMLEMEYQAMVNEHAHHEKQKKLESSVSSNLDKFNSIAAKYGGNLWDD
jgi:Predicted esterase of the alpha-beta hydrolase superfamily